MLSRPQQILLKMAQREAGLSDEEYREALEAVSGCRSSTDSRMGDSHLDALLKYFEAIRGRGIAQGTLQAPSKPPAIFVKPGYWKQRNQPGNTSRDRYVNVRLRAQIEDLEAEFAGLGYGPAYLAAIKRNVTHGRTTPQALHHYRVALERTLASKRKTLTPKPADGPF
jgi:hypothetical protein